jgi:hypothetical protein
MKQLYKPALAIFILVMIYLALKGCGKDKPIQNNTDKIKDAKKSEQRAGIDYKVKLKKSTEVVKLIPIYKDRWHKIYDTIYKQAPDTCHYYLAKLNAEKMASDSINDIVVKTYSDVITAGSVYLAKKDSVILKQDVALKSKDAVIDSLTRSKKKYFKGLKHGVIIGAIIIQGLNTGSRFIK